MAAVAAAAAVAGSGTAGITVKIEVGGVIALVGEATVTAALPVILASASMAGSSSTSSVGDLALDAASDVSGEASTTSDGDVTYDAAAVVAAEATVVSDVDALYAGVGAAVGQATIVAEALGVDEGAADVEAEASATGTPIMIYGPTASVTGGSTVSPFAIVRRASVYMPFNAPQTYAQLTRSIGLQPGRPQHNVRQMYSVVTDPATLRQRNQEMNDEVSASLQRLSSGLRINSAGDDAAGLDLGTRFIGFTVTLLPSGDDDD